MEEMTDAYLSWFSSLGDAGLANDNPTPSSCELQEYYPAEVLDVYGKLDFMVSSCIVTDHNPSTLSLWSEESCFVPR